MTVADRIRYLARSTHASAEFVEHVQRMLALRGVTPGGDAGPFEALLNETFLREAALRTRAQAAVNDVTAWRASLDRQQAATQQQLDRLTAIQAALDRSLRKLHACAQNLRRRAEACAEGDVRSPPPTFAARPVRSTRL